MKKEKEVCQRCGGELDPVFGLCIGECKKLPEEHSDVFDDIETILESHSFFTEKNGEITGQYIDSDQWENLIEELQKQFIITKR